MYIYKSGVRSKSGQNTVYLYWKRTTRPGNRKENANKTVQQI